MQVSSAWSRCLYDKQDRNHKQQSGYIIGSHDSLPNDGHGYGTQNMSQAVVRQPDKRQTSH